MATIKRFEDLLAWQRARVFNKELYSVTATTVFEQDFDLVRQMRRASISISSNIAEGFERKSRKEMGQFLSYAKGSAGELKSQLYLALDLNYVTEEKWKSLSMQLDEVIRLIGGMMSYLNKYNQSGYVKEEEAFYLPVNINEHFQ